MAADKVKTQVLLQFADKSADISDLNKKVRHAWKEAGHKKKDLKTVEVYVKPEEGAAYYVINGETEGRIELF